MVNVKTYEQIEKDLWNKIEELPETQQDFILWIVNEDGTMIGDLLYFGIRKMFEKTLVMVGNDGTDELRPIHTFGISLDERYREYYVAELKEYVSQFGFVGNNYYTFDVED
ncbi:MAG: hypothetical protein IJE43_22550 [Alphaproteobacteria bacterium]|nr:hypothetical protein [Alphaproteobacteria bacterium]